MVQKDVLTPLPVSLGKKKLIRDGAESPRRSPRQGPKPPTRRDGSQSPKNLKDEAKDETKEVSPQKEAPILKKSVKSSRKRKSVPTQDKPLIRKRGADFLSENQEKILFKALLKGLDLIYKQGPKYVMNFNRTERVLRHLVKYKKYYQPKIRDMRGKLEGKIPEIEPFEPFTREFTGVDYFELLSELERGIFWLGLSTKRETVKFDPNHFHRQQATFYPWDIMGLYFQSRADQDQILTEKHISPEKLLLVMEKIRKTMVPKSLSKGPSKRGKSKKTDPDPDPDPEGDPEGDDPEGDDPEGDEDPDPEGDPEGDPDSEEDPEGDPEGDDYEDLDPAPVPLKVPVKPVARASHRR